MGAQGAQWPNIKRQKLEIPGNCPWIGHISASMKAHTLCVHGYCQPLSCASAWTSANRPEWLLVKLTLGIPPHKGARWQLRAPFPQCVLNYVAILQIMKVNLSCKEAKTIMSWQYAFNCVKHAKRGRKYLYSFGPPYEPWKIDLFSIVSWFLASFEGVNRSFLCFIEYIWSLYVAMVYNTRRCNEICNESHKIKKG